MVYETVKIELCEESRHSRDQLLINVKSCTSTIANLDFQKVILVLANWYQLSIYTIVRTKRGSFGTVLVYCLVLVEAHMLISGSGSRARINRHVFADGFRM